MGFDSYTELLTAWNEGQRLQSVVHKTGTSAAALSFYSLWGFSGQPPTGLYTGVALTATACDDGSPVGGLEHGYTATPATKHLLRVAGSCLTSTSQAPYFYLIYDRLLFYPGIDATSTSTQNLTNSTALPRYATGEGVMAWLEVTTALGTGTGTFTYTYTNSAGTAARSNPNTVLTVASAAANRIPHVSGQTNNNNYLFLPLEGSDNGVRSVESVTFTAAHSAGVCALVLGRPLAVLSVPQFQINSEKDLLFNTIGLPRIYDGACISALFYSPASVGASVVQGLDFDFVWN